MPEQLTNRGVEVGRQRVRERGQLLEGEEGDAREGGREGLYRGCGGARRERGRGGREGLCRGRDIGGEKAQRVAGARGGGAEREEGEERGGERRPFVQNAARHTPGDGTAEENRALRGVGMRRQERWVVLAKGLLKRRSFGVEGKGQGRSGVAASIFLSLRESRHGERGGLTSGSERES